MQIYSIISEDNLKKYGTESEKVLSVIINQYSDRTHFIYEILQNAEDVGAEHIKFHLTKEALEVYHNGRPFDEKDIIGVCGIANGTKDDGTRIGHFGIGFKSVYCYTDIPQIYSDKYHFQIKNQLFPEEIAGKKGLSAEETCIILPFNKAEVKSSTAFNEIKEALTRKITADSILMLNNIEHVYIDIDGFGKKIEIDKIKNQISSLDNGKVFSLGVSTVFTSDEGKEEAFDKDYLFFSDNNKETSVVVYAVGGSDGKLLLPIKNAKIYAFFPTAREAHQNFYIHAPFDTTPARDNFKEGEEYGKHNLDLISNICDLITDSLIWMRDHGYLSLRGLNTVFPIYEYEDTDLLYGLYENSIAIINSGVELLPTNIPGVYKAIENICVPQYAVIVDVFSDDDLHQLIDRRKSWLAKEISLDAYSQLRKFLNDNFKLTTLGWSHLVIKMTAPYLERKDLVWMERLMEHIESYCIRKSSDRNYLDVSGIPLVRTSEQKQICACDSNGHYLVYLNNHSVATYKIDQSFLNSESIKRFYRNALQIPDYDVVRQSIDTILPRYSTRQVQRTIDENIEDLKTLKDAVSVNPELKEMIADKYVVTDGNSWYQPGELYIRSDELRSGYSLMKGIINFKYLSDAYYGGSSFSVKLDDEFFRRIGCNSTIRVVQASKNDYLNAVQKYIGMKERGNLYAKIFSKTYQSQKLNWGFNYERFNELFREMDYKKSLRIARFLNANFTKFDIQGRIDGANDMHFSGKSLESAVIYTMIGLILCFEKWIYIKGNDTPYSPLEVDRHDLRAEYLQCKRLIENLPFKEVKNALIDYLSQNIDNETDLELVKRYLANPEALIKAANAMAKSEAREEAKRGKSSSIRDLIQNADKAQSDGRMASNDFEVNPISETGKRKREENLDKILAESMNQEVYVAKGLQFASRTSNEEERQFLLSEYSGSCQICGKQIIKHNGEEYFEAINVIKFSSMNANLARTSKLGWNSLCLCPNCAAEYNYCSKRISSIYDQVMRKDALPGSDTPIGIEIELPEGERRTILYSPRHFIALKEAFKIFTKQS